MTIPTQDLITAMATCKIKPTISVNIPIGSAQLVTKDVKREGMYWRCLTGEGGV